jgi:FkbM family methyltransferase
MAIISYAQNFEDVLLNRLFPECRSGFYIDVGACHPVIHSVTKLFYERGWHGINIEPIPRLSKMLAVDRERDTNLRVGLSNCEETSVFYECPILELSTFSEEQAEELRRQGHRLVEHLVPVTTLARVCDEYAGRTIDFLKIDVESYERQVLEGGDWSRFRPRVVLVEATRPATAIPNYEEWEPLLLTADYLFAFFDGLNRYYVRAEDRQLLPVLGVPANVFDQFEVYEHLRQIHDVRHALEVSENRRRTMQETLVGAEAALEEARNGLAGSRRELDESQQAVHGLRARLETAEAQLETTLAQLAPLQELGPIAVGVARTVRSMSSRSPRIASIAKCMIRHAYPGAGAFDNDA